MTTIHEPTGAINSGSGDQYINPYVILRHVENATRSTWDTRWMARDGLDWLKLRFAEPPHLGTARRTLDDNRILLLSGPAGSGRFTAARMLLHERTDARNPLGHLLDEADHEKMRLSSAQVEHGHRLLLDLSHSNPETLHERQRELPAFHGIIQQQDAYLVVVLPDNFEHHVDADLAARVVEIGRPGAATALQRHLAAEGIELTEDDLGSTLLEPHLVGSMSDIAALARSTVRARDNDQPGTSDSWLNEALTAFHCHREAAGQIAHHSSMRERAVLLAAAMCEDASPDAVFFAAQGLLELLGLTGREGPRLEQQGYREQLKNLVIEIRADHRIGFARYAYDHAVRTHFWDNYPDLREMFSEWVGETIRSVQLTHTDRESLVERFLEQALRSGSVDGLITLVERWADPTKSGGPSYWMQFAARGIFVGLQDQQHGRRFRRLIYDWARSAALPTHVAQLLVHVCTEVIAPAFPRQALVRLHQRARRETGDETPTARSNLLALVSEDDGNFRYLLDRVVNGSRTHHRQVDLQLFLEAADPTRLTDLRARPRPLAADPAVRSHLVHGWHTAMERSPDLAWATTRNWLRTAETVGRPDLLLGILVDAASSDLRLLGALHVVVRDWGLSEAADPAIVARVAQLISSAQGIHITSNIFQAAAQEATR